MWIKIMEPGTYDVEHVDARPYYALLRQAAVCPQVLRQGLGRVLGLECAHRSEKARREVGRDGTSTDTGPHWNSIVNPKP